MTEKEFKKYEGKTTFGFVRGVNIDGCIVIGYDSIRNGSLIVGCYDSRGWICLLTKVKCDGECYDASEPDTIMCEDVEDGYSYLWCWRENVKL